jgi:hypothetical protein
VRSPLRSWGAMPPLARAIPTRLGPWLQSAARRSRSLDDRLFNRALYAASVEAIALLNRCARPTIQQVLGCSRGAVRSAEEAQMKMLRTTRR